MSGTKKAYAGLIVITSLWGISFPIMDFCLTRMGPFTFVALRYMLAAVIIMFLGRKGRTLKELIQLRDLKAGIAIGIPFGAAAVLQMIGLERTSVANASFITGLTVVFVPLIVWIFQRAVPTAGTLTGIVFSLTGVAVMTQVWKVNVNQGDLWVLLSAIAFSIQIYHLEKYGRETESSAVTRVVLVTVAILTLPAAAGVEKMAIRMDWKLLLALIFISVVCTAGAIFIQNLLQPRVPVSKAAVIYLLEPVTATAFAFFLGEQIIMSQILGGLMILAGAWRIIGEDSRSENNDALIEAR